MQHTNGGVAAIRLTVKYHIIGAAPFSVKENAQKLLYFVITAPKGQDTHRTCRATTTEIAFDLLTSQVDVLESYN